MTIKIMLDPGHGGGRAHNRGFVKIPNWPYSNEGDNNFIYCRDYLKPSLERAGFFVGMTKSTIGPDPSLKERGAKGKGYDILISIHTNAANGKATGLEILDSTNSKESDKKLCSLLCGNVSRAIGTNNRGTKYVRNSKGTNFYGILRHGYGKKNFIIEHVFHDNFSDCSKFVNHLKESAEATAQTLASYYGLGGIEKPIEPVKPKDEEQDFIEAVWADIKDTKLRILPSVTIAQAILESDWGRSELAQKGKNLFGIKASKDWKGATYSKKTWEQKSTGEKYQIVADFRKYDSYKDSVLDHDAFFVSTDWRRKNYSPVLMAKEYKTQCQQLQACGYATDLEYGKKLIGIIERNKLMLFDKGVEAIVQAKNIKDPSDWAKESWEWAKEKGITDGSEPGRVATREEVIAMIKRAKELDNGKQCNCTDNSRSGYRTGL